MSDVLGNPRPLRPSAHAHAAGPRVLPFKIAAAKHMLARAAALACPGHDRAQERWGEAVDTVIASQPMTLAEVRAKTDLIIMEGRFDAATFNAIAADLKTWEAAHA
ncbi:MAG: hypothetical protein JOY99_11080 [Sphingomonadaceae bacterium]|nr:hypothetical protein [Sphingomonadaceae bacterium]